MGSVDPDPIEIMPDEPPMFAKPVRDNAVSDQKAKPPEAGENESIAEVDDGPRHPRCQTLNLRPRSVTCCAASSRRNPSR